MGSGASSGREYREEGDSDTDETQSESHSEHLPDETAADDNAADSEVINSDSAPVSVQVDDPGTAEQTGTPVVATVEENRSESNSEGIRRTSDLPSVGPGPGDSASHDGELKPTAVWGEETERWLQPLGNPLNSHDFRDGSFGIIRDDVAMEMKAEATIQALRSEVAARGEALEREREQRQEQVAQLRAEHAAETRELNAKIEGLAATLRDLSQDVVRLLDTDRDPRSYTSKLSRDSASPPTCSRASVVAKFRVTEVNCAICRHAVRPNLVEVDDAGARGDEAQRAQEAAREEVVAFMKQRGMPLQDEMVDSFMSSKPRLARRNVVGQKILVGDQ